MSRVKKSLTALYWLASLGLIAGIVFLMFGGIDMLQTRIKPDSPVAGIKMPPQPPVPAPAPMPVPIASTIVPPAIPPSQDNRIIYEGDEGARTTRPMGEETKFFQRKEFLAGEGRRRRSLTYYLYAPAKPYPAGLKFPLVLVLHDVHGSADAAQYLIEGDMPLKHPAFVVVPVLPFYKKWAMPQDFPEMQGFEPLEARREGLPEAIQLVQQISQDYPIDKGRVYAIGCSDGGFGAFAAALHYPNLFAAAVPIGSGWTGQDARGFAKVPLWIFHGGQDNFYAPELSRNAATYINAYGGRANYTEVPYVGHDCENGQFYRSALWEWLFSQHKKS